MIIDLSGPFILAAMSMNTRACMFSQNNKSKGHSDVCLEMAVSVNEQEEKVYRVNKPTAVLFQSNEVIEEIVADEVVAFSFS